MILDKFSFLKMKATLKIKYYYWNNNFSQVKNNQNKTNRF